MMETLTLVERLRKLRGLGLTYEEARLTTLKDEIIQVLEAVIAEHEYYVLAGVVREVPDSTVHKVRDLLKTLKAVK